LKKKEKEKEKKLVYGLEMQKFYGIVIGPKKISN
jgi:hypothetical protein